MIDQVVRQNCPIGSFWKFDFCDIEGAETQSFYFESLGVHYSSSVEYCTLSLASLNFE